MRHRVFLVALALVLTGLLLPGTALAQQIRIGVSIPAATHGWTGGVNYWADVTAKRLEETYPQLDIIVVTAGSAAEQVNDLEDLVAIHQIDALVILPFESDPLTGPVEQLKQQGIFITVVDRGLAKGSASPRSTPFGLRMTTSPWGSSRP